LRTFEARKSKATALSEVEHYELKIEPPKKLSFGFRELWLYRELFYFFTWRDVKVKYKQTLLGVLWVLLQPVLMVAILTFASKKLGYSSGGISPIIFVFSGLVFWNAFSASLMNGGNSMVNNAAVIRKIYFPRLIIPFSAILVALIDWAATFLLFLVTLSFFPITVNWVDVIWCWPAALVLMVIGTAGACCWLAALNVKYRDFRYVIPFALQAMLFLTPVLYPIDMLYYPGLQYVLALNPMYGVIELFRYPLVHTIDVRLLLVSATSSGLLLLMGVYYFKKTEHYFADLA
jgi:lipopolysaccharide transport system permease protein